VKPVHLLGWLVCLCWPVHAVAAVSVMISGEVGRPGMQTLEGNVRLADVAAAAQVKPDAYVLGASWTQQSRVMPQRRLQAGLVYELGAIADQARREGDASLSALSASLRQWLQAMPVTGRRAVRTLDPGALAATSADNLPVEDGDTLSYPRRPATVRVVGAVKAPCELPHVALQDARRYVEACATQFADRDSLFVIQPDGQVFELGIALWNTSPPMALAPGAIVYVPLDQRRIAGAADVVFNREMAEFIATQPLGGASP
jgi:protein involved in polysaccharide export with SLBB domain